MPNVLTVKYFWALSCKHWNLILLSFLYEKDGKQLVLYVGVHTEAKKLLKMFVFLQKSGANLPLTRRGSTVQSFLL